MNPKNQMEVLIDGKIYKLSGAEEEMYLQKVAAYLNGKIGKLREEEGFSRLSSDYQAVLLQLNIADDYFKEEERANRLENEKSELEKEIYSLKHELITTQMKMEKIKKEQERTPEAETRQDRDAGTERPEVQEKPKRTRSATGQRKASQENKAIYL
ncbi:MAG: cell division protein ZapA [Lachnospiraceae bacterium]|jgi:cell division protein ZapA|nr:cell division protein ZapA [Lachnospiraceae bacterium]